MGRKCNVPECLSEEGRPEDQGVTFHKIPLHSDIRPKWLSLCHISEDKQAIKVIYVCSRHFLKANFCRFKGRKYMLRQGVLPTVFPWNKLPKNDTALESKVPEKPAMEEAAKQDVTKPVIKQEATVAVNDSLPLNAEIKTEPIDIKEEPIPIIDSDKLNPEHLEGLITQHSSTIEHKPNSVQTPTGVLNFAANTKLEALDFNQQWYPARIVEIDYEENEVLIHFERYSSKYDEWISVNSPRLRPSQPTKKKTESGSFVVGEKCSAVWSDSRRFPATITKILDNDMYEVLFDDGYIKHLKANRIYKIQKVTASPLFDPVTGTKQERRDKKRKINVAALFRKRPRHDQGITDNQLRTIEEVAHPDDLDFWVPTWKNGKPVGVDSVIETSDGLRKSIIVDDPRLPPNWAKHLFRRPHGNSAGRWQIHIINPEGRKFKSRGEIKAYIEEHKDLNLYESMFDFSPHKPQTRRQHTSDTHKASLPASTEPKPVVEEPPPIENVKEEPKENCLKIPLVEGGFQCPIESCGKYFRRENLAQMHVKHYHPELMKFMDSTPNVADLAYARTVGEPLSRSPGTEKLAKPQSKVQSKTVTSKVSVKVEPPTVPEFDTPKSIPQTSPLPKVKDCEIIKLLSSQSPEETFPKYPPGLPSNMYPDIKLQDLLNKSEGIPNREDLNLKALGSSTVRPTGIKTLLPVVRPGEIKREQPSAEEGDLSESWSKKSTVTKQSSKRKRPAPEVKENVHSSDTNKRESPLQVDASNNYIVEGGEIIKIVRMKREEIINCTCGITEEDGLMMQCELCMCWQHAYCNNIQRENQVPDKYICYICQNPMRQRSSKKYFHDQDWLKNGTLPVANYCCVDEDVLKKRFAKLKTSHDVSGALIELKDFTHTLKTKIKIAEVKNHPKLYLWSKSCEKLPLPENNLNETALDKSDIQNDSVLFSMLKSRSKDDFSLMDNSLENINLGAPIVPQPEAAIDSADCQLNLLEHISHCQNLVEERLNALEKRIDDLEELELPVDHEQDLIHTQRAVQLLVRDLGIFQEFSHLNTF